MNSIGIIVGRGNSRRLPGKMLRDLAGHPLIAWSCRAATASNLSRVIVSTDHPEIADAATRFGVEAPFLRPPELATDGVGNDKVVHHALSWLQNHDPRNFDIAVLIQPTAPFLRPHDIDACIADVEAKGFACCFTAKASPTPPEWLFRPSSKGGVEPLMGMSCVDKNRKGRPVTPAYQANGAVWAMRCEAFLRTGGIYNPPLNVAVMSQERSIDIDYERDLELANSAIAEHGFTITPEAPRKSRGECAGPASHG